MKVPINVKCKYPRGWMRKATTILPVISSVTHSFNSSRALIAFNTNIVLAI